MWRELIRRLEVAGLSTEGRDIPSGLVHAVKTNIGPVLALTSWAKLLTTLEDEVAADSNAQSDLVQLRALCKSADNQAFVPIASEEITNQRTAAFFLQLNSIVQAATEVAATEGVLKLDGLKYQTGWERRGRYAELTGADGVGIWVGIHYGLWLKHGGTPLWLIFSTTDWGRAHEVRRFIEPWASQTGAFTTWENEGLAMAINVQTGVEKDQVVRGIVDQMRDLSDALSALEPKQPGGKEEELAEI